MLPSHRVVECLDDDAVLDLLEDRLDPERRRALDEREQRVPTVLLLRPGADPQGLDGASDLARRRRWPGPIDVPGSGRAASR